MTKEELKKEAIKFAVGYPTSYGKGYKHKDLRIAYLAGAEPREKRIEELEKENAILKKALNLYVDWTDECGIAWDNFPDMKEKWWKTVEEKGLSWIDGLVFMVTEEAKEQLKEAEQFLKEDK